MSSYNMEPVSSSSSVDDLLVGQPPMAMQPPPPPQRTKRPQLSCNPCRARKVKCDRVQPCTACSLHQIAEVCHYDLSETERQPILQAEALKEKDKEIARLRREIELFGGQSIKAESPVDGSASHDAPRMGLPPRVPRKPSNLRQRRLHTGRPADSIYFGTPGMASVIEEFANLSTKTKPASLTHSVPRGTDIFAFQMATSHPFPTLWAAKDGTSSLVQILPGKDEIFSYLETFQCRAQSCSFPHLPEECTKKEVERFLENVEHNALVHPDMLALLFATLAQGLQNGVYDRSGEKWVAGAMEDEAKKGDVYIAAAMQALRLASFMNRPTLLVVETLVMIGPYLTNSGKFLDAWSLFGVTIRLAQSIGLHRDPSQLNPPAPLEEAMVRKNLWWWMLHMDQQYSMTLGRPLGISSMGDCPAPEPLIPDPVVQSLSNYIAQFSILSRQILSAGPLTNDQIDNFTDQLLALKETLPELIQFDETWLNPEKALPQWPLEAQAAVFHGKTHNYLILLNRQRLENTRRNSNDSAVDSSTLPQVAPDAEKVPRGRERVLQSCRALLHTLDFFATRVRVAMICWTMGQQAFNAAMILTINMLETGETNDLDIVQHTYSTFLEMNKLGIHKLAGAAVEKLGNLMKEREEEGPKETVMGKEGMILLEDPGLQGFLAGGFTPLGFQMAGGAIPYSNANANKGAGWAAISAGPRTGLEQEVSRSRSGLQALRKRVQRRSVASGVVGAAGKPSLPVKKPVLAQQRGSANQRRSSDFLQAQRSQTSSNAIDVGVPASRSVPSEIVDLDTTMVTNSNSSLEVSPTHDRPVPQSSQQSPYQMITQSSQLPPQGVSTFIPVQQQTDFDTISRFESGMYPHASPFTHPNMEIPGDQAIMAQYSGDSDQARQYQLQQQSLMSAYDYNDEMSLGFYDQPMSHSFPSTMNQGHDQDQRQRQDQQNQMNYAQQMNTHLQYPNFDGFHHG